MLLAFSAAVSFTSLAFSALYSPVPAHHTFNPQHNYLHHFFHTLAFISQKIKITFHFIFL